MPLFKNRVYNDILLNIENDYLSDRENDFLPGGTFKVAIEVGKIVIF